MKIGFVHMALMVIGVIAIIVEGIALYRASQEIKEKDLLIASLKAA